MNEYVSKLLTEVKSKNPAEPEFHQTVQEVTESLTLVFERHPQYREAKILERILEPERVIMFRVPGRTIKAISKSTAAFELK